MARKRRESEPSAREIAVAAIVAVRTLQGKVARLQKRVKDLEKAEGATDAIGFRMPQDADDPEVEEMP